MKNFKQHGFLFELESGSCVIEVLAIQVSLRPMFGTLSSVSKDIVACQIASLLDKKEVKFKLNLIIQN